MNPRDNFFHIIYDKYVNYDWYSPKAIIGNVLIELRTNDYLSMAVL